MSAILLYGLLFSITKSRNITALSNVFNADNGEDELEGEANSAANWGRGVIGFANEHIFCHNHSPCTIICDLDYSCENTAITCPTTHECILICDAFKACLQTVITCPVNMQCTIICEEDYSCKAIAINPPQNESNFYLPFKGQGSLWNVKYPIYHVHDQNFTLVCDSYGKCSGMHVICPKYDNCNIICNDSLACQYMEVQWPILDGLGNIICQGIWACQAVNFPILSPTKPFILDCANYGTCEESYITCPTNAACTIKCSLDSSCEEATIVCPQNARCNVIFAYSSSGKNTNIYCQSNSNCNVFCLVSSACTETNIFWSNLSSETGNIICNVSDACYNINEYFYDPSIFIKECADFNITKSTNDGQDFVHNDIDTIQDIGYPTLNNTNLSTTVYLNQQSTNIKCDTDVCYIYCTEIDGCQNTDIKINAANITNISIICNDTSCERLSISIINSFVKNINVLCLITDSCVSLKTNVNNSNVDRFQLFCIDYWSCHSVNINIFRSDVNAEIVCFDNNACDQMQIKGDVSVFITMNMYKYSDMIEIIHPNISNIVTKCGHPKDKHYIKYDTHQIPSQQRLLSFARMEYDSRKLPCEGIHIDCSHEYMVYQSCRMQYKLKSFNLLSLFNRPDTANCYWMEISELFDVICDGNCVESDYYLYNKTLNYDIIFRFDRNAAEINSNQTSQQAKAMSVCESYFASINDTGDTLDSMDGIFEYVLLWISSYDPIKISDIEKTPLTILRTGEFYINCSFQFDTLTIMTNVSVKSFISNVKEFDQMFDAPGGVYVIESQRLLSHMFGVNITMIRIYNETKIQKGWKNEYVAAIIAGFVFFIIIIVSIFFWQKRERMKRLEALTTYIQSPLVIVIAIGEYDKNPQQSDFSENTQFVDLPVEYDIKNLVNLFEGILHYKMAPIYDINGGNKIHWTQDDMVTLLQQKAKYLNDDVERKKHDAVIVFVSSHGVKDHIVTSDIKKLNKDTIHRIFSVDFPALRDLPAIFMYDCCDGSNDFKEEGRESDDNQEKKFNKQQRKGKYVKVGEHVVSDAYGSGKEIWFQGEPNPDFKLVIVNSSNRGFTSQLGSKSGSVMTRLFTEKLTRNLTEDENKLFLYEIFHEIQEELHDKSLQLVEAKYNNKLEYIKLKPHVASKGEEIQLTNL